MRESHLGVVALAALLFSGCHRATPSAESALLEEKIIPRIIAWSMSRDETLNLYADFGLQSYDSVCLIPDYNCLNHVKNVGKIEEYHSSFGVCIPENNYALMLVKDGKVHAALLSREDVTVAGLPSWGKCVKPSKAGLLMEAIQPRARTTVELTQM